MRSVLSNGFHGITVMLAALLTLRAPVSRAAS